MGLVIRYYESHNGGNSERHISTVTTQVATATTTATLTLKRSSKGATAGLTVGNLRVDTWVCLVRG